MATQNGTARQDVAEAGTSRTQIDKALKTLQRKKGEWADLSITRKMELLLEVRKRIVTNLVPVGRAGAEARATAQPTEVMLETLAYGMSVSNYINKLMKTLHGVRGSSEFPYLQQGQLANGQKVAKVFPVEWADSFSLIAPFVSAELYLEPNQPVTQGSLFLRPEAKEGRVAAILGAGNHGFLSVKDVLVALFERNEVVILKPHPQLAKWQALANDALEPLLRWGYYYCVECDTLEDTQYLLHHPAVDCVHMTGGRATHDAIVWGSSKEEQERRKAAKDPLLKVPITSELGGVSPAIVVGGKWTDKELNVQAKSVAAGVVSNNSCNCNATKVLILPEDWAQADAFVAKVKEVLSQCPLLPAAYPGIRQRYEAWREHYPTAETITATATPSLRDVGPPLPYLVNTFNSLPADPQAEYAFQVEPFAPVLSVVKLPSRGIPDFLSKAAAFANDNLSGTLSAVLMVTPAAEKEHSDAVQQALQDLRYGLVAVNTWPATNFLVGPVPWGAYKGDQTIYDIGSGTGPAGNPYMVDHVQKVVYRAPITGLAVAVPVSLKPLPLWLARLLVAWNCDQHVGVFNAFFRANT